MPGSGIFGLAGLGCSLIISLELVLLGLGESGACFAGFGLWWYDVRLRRLRSRSPCLVCQDRSGSLSCCAGPSGRYGDNSRLAGRGGDWCWTRLIGAEHCVLGTSVACCRTLFLACSPCLLLLLLLWRCGALLAAGTCGFVLCWRCGGGIGCAAAVTTPLRGCAQCACAGAFAVVAGC